MNFTPDSFHFADPIHICPIKFSFQINSTRCSRLRRLSSSRKQFEMKCQVLHVLQIASVLLTFVALNLAVYGIVFVRVGSSNATVSRLVLDSGPNRQPKTLIQPLDHFDARNQSFWLQVTKTTRSRLLFISHFISDYFQALLDQRSFLQRIRARLSRHRRRMSVHREPRAPVSLSRLVSLSI